MLAPPGGLAGRFDLADEATAYLADSPETALYESLFRREVRSCHFSRIEQRALMTFETQASLRLVDLRGLRRTTRYCSPCATRRAKHLLAHAGNKGCTACCTRRHSTPATAACACLARVWSAPRRWLPLILCRQAQGCCTKRWCWQRAGRKCRSCESDFASVLIAGDAINTGG
ncbi:MAG: RES domain-containing protein [Betaproteobacteria bacterium]|nr:RES domain-containing protein [Betaproteobacteria bacterium]